MSQNVPAGQTNAGCGSGCGQVSAGRVRTWQDMRDGLNDISLRGAWGISFPPAQFLSKIGYRLCVPVSSGLPDSPLRV